MKNMVGGEETTFQVNTIVVLSFVDQLIERRGGSTKDLNSKNSMISLSGRTYTRTAESIIPMNSTEGLQAVRRNYGGRGVTSHRLKTIRSLSSVTHQDNRGVKPIQLLNSKLTVCLPLMKTVGEEKTSSTMNLRVRMFFADQSIERRGESILTLKSSKGVTFLSDRTYTRTAEPIEGLNFNELLKAVRSNHEGRGATMESMKSISSLSSTTRQDNRGAKPNYGIHLTAAQSLPLTETVGEEETTSKMNTICKLSFAGQSIERRGGSITLLKSTIPLIPSPSGLILGRRNPSIPLISL